MRSPRRCVLTLAAGLALVATAGCSGTNRDDPALVDTKTQAEVLARLAADTDTNPFDIAVAVAQGVVTLTGTVDDAADRDEAERLAGASTGVVRVVNEIVVGTTEPVVRLDDGAVTATVKAKLAASSQLNPYDIQVATADGAVSLSGQVATEAEKAEAERLARETDGVVRVHNFLTVGSPG